MTLIKRRIRKKNRFPLSKPVMSKASQRVKDMYPPKVNVGGYLYVIGFSNGRTKFGITTDLAIRITKHSSDADAYGCTVLREWWSLKSLVNPKFFEDELKKRLSTRREYVDVPFDVVQRQVEMLGVVGHHRIYRNAKAA